MAVVGSAILDIINAHKNDYLGNVSNFLKELKS
jgi:tryptophan synthase alpha subunit